MKRAFGLTVASFLIAACDPNLPPNCTSDAAQKLIRTAYQDLYKTEAQKPAMPTTSDIFGFAVGSFQAGAKARAVQIAAMSLSQIALSDVKEYAEGGAIPDRGIKKYRICQATVTVPLPGPESVLVGIFEMVGGGELQTQIEPAP